MKLAWVIRYVPDAMATARFYGEAFGLTQRFAGGEDFIAMETGATVLAFCREGFVTSGMGLDFAPTRPGARPPGEEIGFEVEDVPAAHARALAAGALEVLAPVEKPWGQTVSYLRDPNGALVELCTAITA
ncbi:VOC family protein [Roseococcus sp. SDR]|uniref:VOC family protein n=1 Tax=Roseococcus sp. SDR TaxID=2835532 RepID=UPI001BCF414A|nr:VOC family protein [Roseococcus sp. SDR]MBS7792384.1 VOC family protein [Roseococcus sp. SDR]MBV1847698.1 VOC family protein [Roseococcus sp. SDR]